MQIHFVSVIIDGRPEITVTKHKTTNGRFIIIGDELTLAFPSKKDAEWLVMMLRHHTLLMEDDK